jgi:hypothetical protein
MLLSVVRKPSASKIFNEGDLEIFRLEVCERLNFEFFFFGSLKIELIYKKWLWKEKLVE